MIKVKDAAAAAEKFKARGQAAAGDYTAGIRGAGQDWQRATIDGAENYAAGVQAAIGRGAFAKGVSESGGAYYEQRATTIGAQRFPQGIAAGAGNWQEGAGKYLDTLKGLTLPPRAPKGDPRNFARAQAVAEAMRAKKVSS